MLVAPGGAVTLALSGHFTQGLRRERRAGRRRGAEGRRGALAPWAIAATLIVEAGLFSLGKAIGADSLALIAIVPLTALASVMVDTVRAAFQGMLKFLAFGVSWLIWCAAQFALGAIGLMLARAAWAAFLGMLAANLLTLICLVVLLRAHFRRAYAAARRRRSRWPRRRCGAQHPWQPRSAASCS